jgi:sugar lactone lactonase YvrE
MQNHIVRRIDAQTKAITTVAGNGSSGYSGDGGPATNAQLSSPHSIALDDVGNLYIADIGNHRIRRVNLARRTIETIAGDGQRALPTDGAVARGQSMAGPRALYLRGDSLWIALREGNSVWRMALSSQRLSHVAGRGQAGYSGDGGSAKNAAFNGPKGIVVDKQDRVYVVDTENQVIRLIDTRVDRVTTIAGSGQRGFGGDGGPATAALLDRPHGICLGPDNSIYIGDTNNHRVRVVRVEPDP